MRTFLVSLNITTASAQLQELSELLQVEPSPHSQERGQRPDAVLTRFVGKRALKLTCWRLESRAAARADLAAHVASIFQRLPVERLTRQRALLPRDSQIALDIGVFNDRPITVVEIPNKILNELSGVGCKVEVTVYPISSAKRKEMGAHPKRKVKGHPPVK